MKENNQNQTTQSVNQPTSNEKMKKCKHCQSAIPQKAKVCPVCRKKQGGILKWVIIAFVVICIFGAAGGNNSSDSEVKNVTTTPEPQTTTESTVEPTTVSAPKAEVETPSETVFHVGETAEYKDVQVSVLGYEESTGNDWSSPAEGKVFIFPEIEIVNNSTEEISISSLLSFDCYCDDYKMDFSAEALMAMSTDDSKSQLDGSVAPGKRMKGVLGIEVPADWSTIEIYYKDNAWLSSNFSFEITK